MVDRIVSKIRHWSVKLLNIAGRIQLVKSIVLEIAQYWMSSLPLPDSIIKKLDTICRYFIWSGITTPSKKKTVAWKKVCRPVKQGGVNILNLKIWNHVALLKCLWNICMELDNLEVKWIHTYYLKGCDITIDFHTNNCTWILKHIMARKVDIDKIQQLCNNMVLNRKFKTMQVYNALIEDNNKVDWYHMMHHNIARPRVKVIMWLVFQDRLPTKSILKRLDLLQHTNCELCEEDEETMAHLMFNCKGTANI